ncbi:hypothetical protein [Ciceribacter sp. RN22]|uniref:hypothetical protein n=1 Tax=Ciceribacter sp. RN22 TaxID=2954932 RepID=UPI00209357DC|nr:hypothetical protein [Ciceribacter sp. RN22]MCO6176589.1 hypothetical protein [Ciceribacter sp. RN22]
MVVTAGDFGLVNPANIDANPLNAACTKPAEETWLVARRPIQEGRAAVFTAFQRVEQFGVGSVDIGTEACARLVPFSMFEQFVQR